MKGIVITAFAFACFTITAIIGLMFTKDSKDINLHFCLGVMFGVGAWLGEKVYDKLTKK